MAHKKTVNEKLQTKLKPLESNNKIVKDGNIFKIEDRVFLECFNDKLVYGCYRFFPSQVESIKKDKYSVTIILKHETLEYISKNPINPPKGVKKVYDVFKNLGSQIKKIIIGADENNFEKGIINITEEIYDTIQKVDKEEGQEKNIRIFNRILPFLEKEFNIEENEKKNNRDYSLLIQEILANDKFLQDDLIKITSKLDKTSSRVVIEKQVTKQTQWLVDTIEDILEKNKLTKEDSKKIGKEKFGYPKKDINGPEHLMEKILTDYGQYSLFGVPALLNTNKYIIHEGNSRSQIDLILINHLGDIELVELKRPDDYIFEYGDGRGKFYPSKNLAIAISQLERYITAVYKDNDDEYLINEKKIREFINSEVGDTLSIESIRPKGLIIIGSWKKICKPYDELNQKQKGKIKEEDYNKDSMQAYKELKNSLKNITIMTYSELLENVRTRLQANNENTD